MVCMLCLPMHCPVGAWHTHSFAQRGSIHTLCLQPCVQHVKPANEKPAESCIASTVCCKCAQLCHNTPQHSYYMQTLCWACSKQNARACLVHLTGNLMHSVGCQSCSRRLGAKTIADTTGLRHILHAALGWSSALQWPIPARLRNFNRCWQ
jgi:hypothetical protein